MSVYAAKINISHRITEKNIRPLMSSYYKHMHYGIASICLYICILLKEEMSQTDKIKRVREKKKKTH